MELSRDTVAHVSRLAHIGLTSEEVQHLSAELASVVEHVSRLRELDTTGVEPTAHTLPAENVMREDEPRPSWSPEAVVANAPRRVTDQFAVQAIFD